jgi:alanine racemase
MREALIRPQAIAHNVQAIRQATSAAKTLVVVKAGGYGHGALTAARAALEGGADWLGTADVDEALELREAGITAPVLSWLFGPSDDLSVALENGIDVGVSSLGQLAQVVSQASPGIPASPGTVARVHLKIDTGLGRSGATPDQWAALCEAAATAEGGGKVRVVGVFSHLSGASAEADAIQGAAFALACDQARATGLDPELCHISASNATSNSPELSSDMVRIGIAAYGVPVAGRFAGLGLRPAMRFSGQVVLTKRVSSGQGVGYGHTYQTTSETTLALVPLGYADGVPRHASSAGPVVIAGRRFSVSGRVSMDQFSVDVGDHGVREGDWCVLWGDPAEGHPSVEEWAEAAGTIGYEMITRVGPRVPRVIER